MYASAGGDGLGTRNIDEDGDPITVYGVHPYPDPYDGQFVQLDVINYEAHE